MPHDVILYSVEERAALSVLLSCAASKKRVLRDTSYDNNVRKLIDDSIIVVNKMLDDGL